jgi:hypothetical protein
MRGEAQQGANGREAYKHKIVVREHAKKHRRVFMALDITKIPGYKDGMTAEEQIALLKNYEPDYSGYIRKDVFDKTASELADLKKQLKAKMTEEEAKAAEQAANEKALRDELEALRKESAIAKNKANFLKQGYDDDLAEKAAEALATGDSAKLFEYMNVHIENVKKIAAAAAMAGDHVPPAGQGGSIVNKKMFDAMTSDKQLEFIKENPNWKEIIIKE